MHTTTTALDFVIAEGLIGRRFIDMEPHEQRTVLDALIDTVTVAPAVNRGANGFKAARVAGKRIAWKV